MRRNTISLTLKLLKYVHCGRQIRIGGRGSAWRRNLGVVSFLWVWCARHRRRLKPWNGSIRKRGNGGEGGGEKRRTTEIGEERLGGEISRRTILKTRDSSEAWERLEATANHLEVWRENPRELARVIHAAFCLSTDSNEGQWEEGCKIW